MIPSSKNIITIDKHRNAIAFACREFLHFAGGTLKIKHLLKNSISKLLIYKTFISSEFNRNTSCTRNRCEGDDADIHRG